MKLKGAVCALLFTNIRYALEGKKKIYIYRKSSNIVTRVVPALLMGRDPILYLGYEIY